MDNVSENNGAMLLRFAAGSNAIFDARCNPFTLGCLQTSHSKEAPTILSILGVIRDRWRVLLLVL